MPIRLLVGRPTGHLVDHPVVPLAAVATAAAAVVLPWTLQTYTALSNNSLSFSDELFAE